MRVVAALFARFLRIVRCVWQSMNYRRISTGKRIEYRCDHLLDGAIRRIDGERRTCISLTPFFHQLGDALFNRHAAVRYHRARFDAACDSPRNHLRACTEADNHAAIAERRIILRVNDRTAAERDNRGLPMATLRAAPGVRSDFRNHASFHRPEMHLAAITEDLMNRLSGACADLRIAVDQSPPQSPGQEPGDRAFAGCHKAGQDHLRCHL